jgi:hypothetical protein
LGSDDPRRGHSGAGNLLDLTGGASSVIDPDTLPKPQLTDVLLTRDLLCQRWGNQRKQDAATKRQNREALDG